jgi:hypothetical protein
MAVAVIYNDGKIHTIDYAFDDWLEVYDGPFDQYTTVNFTAGAYITKRISVWDNSKVNMYDGTLCGVISYNGTETNIYGGAMGSSGNYANYWSKIAPFSILSDGNVNIYDGIVWHDIVARNTSQINIFGGDIKGDIDIGTGGHISLYGSNFSYNGNPIGNMTFGDGTSGHITGVLQNGDAIDCFFGIYYGSLIIIPEPASLLLLSLGGLLFRYRK